MKHRLLSSIAVPATRDPAAQWLCRSCLARQGIRFISTTPSQPASASAEISFPQSLDALPVSLSKESGLTDPYSALKTLKLPHAVPSQLLVHVNPQALNDQELAERQHLLRWSMAGHVDAKFNLKRETNKEIKGVVVSAGKMDRTVKVRVPGQRYEKSVKKYYTHYTNHLTHDPNNSLREGDVVILHRYTVSKTVKHIVASIASPFGSTIDERQPIPSPEDRLYKYKANRMARLDARLERVQAVAAGVQPPTKLKVTAKKQASIPKLTESAILQAERYQQIWMERNSAKEAPLLRKPAPPPGKRTGLLRAWKRPQAAVSKEEKVKDTMKKAVDEKVATANETPEVPS